MSAMVIIRQHQWLAIALTSRWDAQNSVWTMDCGVSIADENISTPATGIDVYSIYFADDKDAAWFILCHGGEVCK